MARKGALRCDDASNDMRGVQTLETGKKKCTATIFLQCNKTSLYRILQKKPLLDWLRICLYSYCGGNRRFATGLDGEVRNAAKKVPGTSPGRELLECCIYRGMDTEFTKSPSTIRMFAS